MIIYIGKFVISILFLYISETIKRYKVLSAVFLVGALFVPCYLASQRDISVGADTRGYIYGMFNLAQTTKSSLLEYLTIVPLWYAIPRTIVGYTTLTWVCAQLNDGFQILLFTIEFLVIFPMYCAIRKATTNKYERLMGFALFFLFLYNVSLNAARQTIALSFYLLAFVYMMKKNYKGFILVSIVGFLFHDTIILIILIAIIKYKIIDGFKSVKKQKRYELYIIGLSVLAVIGFYPLLEILVRSGIYPHGNIYLVQRRFDFSFIRTALYTIVYMGIVFNKKFMIQTREDEFYRFISILSIIWLQAGVLIKYADRLSWYLFFPIISIYLPKIANKRGRHLKKKRGLYTAIIIASFLVFWIVLYGINNEHATVPYMVNKG